MKISLVYKLLILVLPALPFTVRGQEGSGDEKAKPIAELPASDAKEKANPYRPPTPEEMDSPVIKAICKTFGTPKGGVRLSPEARLWVNKEKRQVIIDGFIAINEGPLEMFACPIGTKEHESAVSLLARSRFVHAALLAVASTPGRPVRFRPEFTPPTGDRIGITILWKDKNGASRKVKAQEWVCRTGTEETLDVDWVFCGSQWWTDPQTGRDFYTADDGDLVCVSNFSSATLDIPIESSKANEALAFSAYTKKMPPIDTPIRMVMQPLDPPLNARSKAKETDSEKAATSNPAKAADK